MDKIFVIKGVYSGKIKISNCTFTLLKPIEHSLGQVYATVDASNVLGDEYKAIKISVQDYKLLA